MRHTNPRLTASVYTDEKFLPFAPGGGVGECAGHTRKAYQMSPMVKPSGKGSSSART